MAFTIELDSKGKRIFDYAFHPNTSDNEKLVAIRKLADHGIVPLSDDDIKLTYRAVITSLKGELELRAKEVADLQELVAKLKSTVTHTGKVRMTRERAELVRHLWNRGGLTYQDLADEFSVSQSTIGNILSRRVFK